jgi:uncharacterized protein with HEPN domain
MPPESAKYLRDMLDAARAIEQYAQDKTLADFLEQRATRDAAQWNFCVIGEALSQLRRVDEPTAQRITDHWKIVVLRNQLIHGYGVIDNSITWNIIEEKLPILIRELNQLLGE